MSENITPEEIKRIRGKYGLSQQAFARVLGIGEASIARYEKGQEPTRANANLIRAAKNASFMLDCIERDGSRITPAQRKHAEQIIYAEVTFNEKGEPMTMNEIYEVTLQQEVLSEQAALMLADLYRMREKAEERGDEALVMILEDATRQIALAKHKITSSEYGTITGVAELRGRIHALMDFALSCEAKAA